MLHDALRNSVTAKAKHHVLVLVAEPKSGRRSHTLTGPSPGHGVYTEKRGLLRTARPFRSLALAGSRGTAVSRARCALVASRAGMVLDKVVDELLQFFQAEFAIVVRVELHCVGGHAIGIRPHRMITPWTAGPLWPTTFWAATVNSATFTTATAWCTIGSARGTWPTGPPLWAELVIGQFAVLVFVEGPQSGCRLLQFVGADDAVVVGVQCFDDGAGGPRSAVTTRSSRSTWSTRDTTLTPGTSASGRLGDGGRESGDDDETAQPNPAFHGEISVALIGSQSRNQQAL